MITYAQYEKYTISNVIVIFTHEILYHMYKIWSKNDPTV